MLRPDIQWKNPVMFVVEVGAVLTLLFVIQAALGSVVQPGAAHLLHRAGRLAVPDRAVRELCHRLGRSARQGAGRVAAQDARATRRLIACVAEQSIEEVSPPTSSRAIGWS